MFEIAVEISSLPLEYKVHKSEIFILFVVLSLAPKTESRLSHVC